ncbi:ABC transporter ATP-binding protein [Ktedonobacter sp. SOSP1-85]|uniref:ABC transporter ATP-binding protein n=1 Tax=Ktedonobacter sp. SOSP1-85 TaxID=2778367 RepID=UPI001915ACD1|nr:ABC transporter ATP-binding protein [Ktedonobacter sp. SOSP1-85]GHO75666.1 ABC transporter ATP-binding protein [Ktedonobacter sp. SOSP1-85]
MKYISPSYDKNIVISTNRLTKAFGNLVAVNDLHLQVMRGDVFGFLGPNGSGKTTTIRMLLGLIRPTAGSAIIFGMDNAHQLPHILQRVGAIVETPVFYPYLSGLDNLRVVAATSGMMSGKSNDRRLAEVLEIVELRSYQKLNFRQYSLGMKQRLGIAAALLTDPELVLLDEPTNGLDPAGMIEIRKLIKRLSELGKTIFLSSHLLHEVQQVCNRVAIMQKGNLLKQGEVATLLQTSEMIEVRLNTPQESERALAIIQQHQEHASTWLHGVKLENKRDMQPVLLIEAPITHSSEVNALLAHNDIFAAEIRPREGNLEDVFLEVTTGGAGSHTGMEALAEHLAHANVTIHEGDQVLEGEEKHG